jgi:hypothetical protein
MVNVLDFIEIFRLLLLSWIRLIGTGTVQNLRFLS